MSAQIHIDRNGERFGPFSLEDVNSHLASGSLQPTDLAWSDGMQSWVPIGQIPGIITSVGSAAPPPPAPAANPTCPNCHTEVESSQIICMNCGTNLQTGEGTNTRILVVSESGSRKKMVLVAAFAVPLLGLAAYFGVNHFFSSKDIKTAQTQPTTQTQPVGPGLPTDINEETPKEPQKKNSSQGI